MSDEKKPPFFFDFYSKLGGGCGIKVRGDFRSGTLLPLFHTMIIDLVALYPNIEINLVSVDFMDSSSMAIALQLEQMGADVRWLTQSYVYKRYKDYKDIKLSVVLDSNFKPVGLA